MHQVTCSSKRSVRERASARTEREEAVPVEGTCALDRAPTQKNFTKNNFSIHHGSGRGSLSLLAVVLIYRPLPQRPLSTWRDFPAPSVGAVMQEVGPVWFVYSTTLLEPAKGETDDLGVRHQASCPDLLHTVPDPYLA